MNDQPRQTDPAIPTGNNESTELDLHDQVIYETPEPFEDIASGPRWFYLFSVVALVVGAFYLGRHMGNLDTEAHIGFLQAQKQQSGQGGAAAVKTVSGAAVFTSRCVSCHQANGQGIPGAFPPLVKSTYVLGDPQTLVRIVLQGLQGEIKVEGQAYNGLMPPWQDQLSDEETTAVINYIRTELGGNQAGQVDVELVQKIRAAEKDRQKPWTVPELEALEKS
ncbi:Cytochrome C oxidase, cbb3-type, subunit III [Methylobacillus rhizosphaerae]|uniref:Cytochrome C oxidase, cbb3-type, subunit III n=1 Tax=Methylobacillus rhizosphaerae TaxID=551994 RepID=A0A238ZRS3_9PROT|nr:cytochrome c [Methylobacillus rhizosphaerae]SNR86107.1 Cytochrome C oxidase, cbb3-type, subunit III [Methylobacillus rhizosphaerae]